jgi:hypothetical protein
MDPIKVMRSIAGDRARRKGFAMRRCVVRVRVDEVTWISRGRCASRLAVRMDNTRGMIENSRSLIVIISK